MPNASRIGHCLPVTWVIDVYQKAQLHQFIAHELHQMVQQNLLVDICSCWDRLQKHWSRNLGTLSPQDYIHSKLTKMAMVFHPSLCVCPLQGDFAAPCRVTLQPFQPRGGVSSLPLESGPVECSRKDSVSILSLGLARPASLGHAIATREAQDSLLVADRQCGARPGDPAKAILDHPKAGQAPNV